MTADEVERTALCALVAPWLPGVTIDHLDIRESCGCYSEWTQDPPYYHVTFPAAQGTEADSLWKLASALEPIITQFAMVRHCFSGGECCQGEGYTEDEEVTPSVNVRIIPANMEESK